MFTVMWLRSVVWILEGDRRKMYLFAVSQISQQLLKRHKTYTYIYKKKNTLTHSQTHTCLGSPHLSAAFSHGAQSRKDNEMIRFCFVSNAQGTVCFIRV